MGMAYILCQLRNPDNEQDGLNIISCDSTTFKKGQCSYSPFEAELAAIHYCMTKEDYFTRGARKITVRSDAKNMNSFLKSDLDKISNPREQRMVEKLMPYNIHAVYVPGKDMAAPDFGSRHPASEGDYESFQTEVGRLGVSVRSRRVMSLDVKDPKLEVLAKMASEDPTYCKNVEDINLKMHRPKRKIQEK